KVRPMYNELKEKSINGGLITPKAAYGYFPCYSEGNSLFVESANGLHEFSFPRQELSPHFCISDFYHTKKEGGDIASFFVVTIGERIDEEIKKLFTGDEYHDYLIMHGFSVEVTDALAEYWHEEMRKEMGVINNNPQEMTGYITQEYQGSRYGFGYPACPELDAHKEVFKLIKPEGIGVTLTENMQMVPEQTTSAIIAHHPQAKYFAV
ncbi:MAG: 5-methyltetrahydrofolate--homocysteine methyltransferase, partial [Fibrobacteria bacterium]|nr:5-methyltetrahydrofolate--homocysteine methyltransferase [Fibrobacteria bacterium]